MKTFKKKSWPRPGKTLFFPRLICQISVHFLHVWCQSKEVLCFTGEKKANPMRGKFCVFAPVERAVARAINNLERLHTEGSRFHYEIVPTKEAVGLGHVDARTHRSSRASASARRARSASVASATSTCAGCVAKRCRTQSRVRVRRRANSCKVERALGKSRRLSAPQ